jgi:hypothetical protein
MATLPASSADLLSCVGEDQTDEVERSAVPLDFVPVTVMLFRGVGIATCRLRSFRGGARLRRVGYEEWRRGMVARCYALE